MSTLTKEDKAVVAILWFRMSVIIYLFIETKLKRIGKKAKA